jgi:hypothetical protein
MKTWSLAMPPLVATLSRHVLDRQGLHVHDHDDDFLMSQLEYEDGSIIHVAIFCMGYRSFFIKKSAICVSMIQPDKVTGSDIVHFTERLAYPTSIHDIRYVVTLSSFITAAAAALAEAGGMGKCLNWPKSRNGSDGGGSILPN